MKGLVVAAEFNKADGREDGQYTLEILTQNQAHMRALFQLFTEGELCLGGEKCKKKLLALAKEYQIRPDEESPAHNAEIWTKDPWAPSEKIAILRRSDLV
jgi:hypothetical protein